MPNPEREPYHSTTTGRGAISLIKVTLLDISRIIRSPGKRVRELYGDSLYRNAVYLILNSGVGAGSGFFFWAVAARLYSAESVGIASAVIAAMVLLSLLATLGLDYGLVHFLPGAGGKARNMTNSCFTVGGLTAIVLSLVFLAGLPLWSPALLSIRQNLAYPVAFVIFTAAITLQSFTQQTFVAGRKAEFALWQGLIFSLLRFIPLVALAVLFGAFGILTSWGIAVSLGVLVSVFLFLPRLQAGYRPLPTINSGAIRGMIRFSLANYFSNIFWTVPSLALPLMVVNVLGAEPNAYFSIGWATGSILFMVPMLTSLSLFAEGSHNQERLARDVTRSLKLILLIIVPAIIVLFTLGDKILLLFGRAYSEGATGLLRVLAASALPFSINCVYFGIKRAQGEMKSVVGLNAFSAAATLGASYVLLPLTGIIGVGIAWLSAQGIVSLVIASGFLARRLAVRGRAG